jgi:hypothetical protein
MVAAFTEQLREARRNRRWLAEAVVWAAALVGLPPTAFSEHQHMIRQDLRHAIRILSAAPGFTSVAVLSLALGIGANTAIFSLLNSVLMSALPVRDPHELVMLTAPGARGHLRGMDDGERSIVGADVLRTRSEGVIAAGRTSAPRFFSGNVGTRPNQESRFHLPANRFGLLAKRFIHLDEGRRRLAGRGADEQHATLERRIPGEVVGSMLIGVVEGEQNLAGRPQARPAIELHRLGQRRASTADRVRGNDVFLIEDGPDLRVERVMFAAAIVEQPTATATA